MPHGLVLPRTGESLKAEIQAVCFLRRYWDVEITNAYVHNSGEGQRNDDEGTIENLAIIRFETPSDVNMLLMCSILGYIQQGDIQICLSSR